MRRRRWYDQTGATRITLGRKALPREPMPKVAKVRVRVQTLWGIEWRDLMPEQMQARARFNMRFYMLGDPPAD